MIAIFWISVLITVLNSSLALRDNSNFLFNSDRFPEREARPTLSNGNLGFVVHSDSVFLNGVYNGRGSQSHRARIPNYANLQLVRCALPEIDPPQCSYQLDIEFGRFRTVFEDAEVRVVHDVYPHRLVDHAIVNSFRIQRLGSQTGTIQAAIQRRFGAPSADISLDPAQSILMRNETYLFRCGRTNEGEDPLLQAMGTEVCIYYSDIPSVLELTSDRTGEQFHFSTVFARSRTVGLEHLQLITLGNPELSHTRLIESTWDMYGITVDGNNELDRAIKASSFQLFGNVPSFHPIYQMYGVSPSGLGRGGGIEEDFQGHNLWDLDLWIFPIILLFDRFNARELIRYRSITIRNALASNAAEQGFEGWQFPWASAFTGREVAPLGPATEFRHHITGDVAFGARQYLLATDDLTWMLMEGCQLAYETAKFWKSRAVYNPTTDKFDILSVTGPDSTHRNVNNNVFTNVVAAHNLFFGEFAGCMCRNTLGLQESDWTELTKVARSLQLLHNEVIDFHPQYDGYTLGMQIGQADAVLLGYPLELPMNDSTKRQNLDIYGHVTISNGPAMTWPMHTIGWLELDELDRAAEDFRRSYEPYLRAPFNVWHQKPAGHQGASNFVTGAGGFLQAIVNGYAGVRIHNEEMVINKPRLPPGTTRLYIPHITYMRAIFSLEVRADGFTINFKHAGTRPSLQVFVDGQEHEMCTMCQFSGSRNARLKYVRPAEISPGCTLHPTTLNMKLADQNKSGGCEVTSRINPLLVVFVLIGWLLNKWA